MHTDGQEDNNLGLDTTPVWIYRWQFACDIVARHYCWVGWVCVYCVCGWGAALSMRGLRVYQRKQSQA